MNTFPLEDKSVIITGGLGGYGLAIANIIIKRGGRVLLTDIKTEVNLEDYIGTHSHLKDGIEAKTVLYTKCDVTSEAEIEAAFEFANKNLALPDKLVEVLINGAGIVGEENWEKIYEVNIKGVHYGILQGFKHMKNGGVVVNISSTAGLTCLGDASASPAYVTSKHAVNALTRTFGTDLYFNRHKVRVIAAAPYFIETSLNEDNFSKWNSDPEALQIIRKAFEGKTMLTPDEAALKLVNVLNAKNGSVWLIRPEQMQPFNVPDYVLPKTRTGPAPLAPKVWGMR